MPEQRADRGRLAAATATGTSSSTTPRTARTTSSTRRTRNERRWKAGSGAIYDLRSDKLRPAGWTSADAAGLPILPGLVTYAEVASGHIDHAIRVTVPRTPGRVPVAGPAPGVVSHDTSLPPMGLRLRLKASVDISHLPNQARIVATAMKKYGVIVADNGSPWYISGAPDSHWNNDQLHALGRSWAPTSRRRRVRAAAQCHEFGTGEMRTTIVAT